MPVFRVRGRRRGAQRRTLVGFRNYRPIVRMQRPRALTTNRVGQIYRFKRWTTSSNINANTGFGTPVMTDNTAEAFTLTTPFAIYNTGTGGVAGSANYLSFAVQFCLADLPDVSEFGALFDQYRIKTVHFKIFPMSTSGLPVAAGVGGAADGYTLTTVHSCIDNDDLTPFVASEAGVLAMMQYNNYKMRCLSSNNNIAVVSRKLRPRVQQVLVNTADALTATGLAKHDQWIDMAFTSVPNRGVKVIVETKQGATTSNVAIEFRIIAKYIIECRDTR